MHVKPCELKKIHAFLEWMKRIVILGKIRSEGGGQLSHINSQELDWKCPPLQEAGYYINQTSRGGVANRRREEITNGQADPLVRALRRLDTHFHSVNRNLVTNSSLLETTGIRMTIGGVVMNTQAFLAHTHGKIRVSEKMRFITRLSGLTHNCTSMLITTPR